MKALIISILLVLFSNYAVASADTSTGMDCRQLVATTAVMVTNRFPADKGTIRSVTAPVDAVEHYGNSASMFVTQTGDGMSLIAGKDQWLVSVTRVSANGTDVYVYGATTRPGTNGQCLLMEITLVDKRS